MLKASALSTYPRRWDGFLRDARTITEISQDRFTGPAFGLGGVLRDNSEALSNAYNPRSVC